MQSRLETRCSAKNGRRLIPNGGNDRIYTPDRLAFDLVAHINPCGRILEPAAGGGAFLRAFDRLGVACDWCEIDKGRDFFNFYPRFRYDFIVSNPPYSIFTRFLQHSLNLSNNIVFVCPINSWFQRCRERLLAESGFGIVEIIRLPVPPPPWPQFGLSLGAAWLKRGWQASPQITRLPSNLWPASGDKMVLATKEAVS